MGPREGERYIYIYIERESNMGRKREGETNNVIERRRGQQRERER